MRRLIAAVLMLGVGACEPVQLEEPDAAAGVEPDAAPPITETPDAGSEVDAQEEPSLPPVEQKGKLALAVASRDFGKVSIGQSSAVVAVTLTNGGAGSVRGIVFARSGAAPTDFPYTALCNGGTLEAGATCEVGLAFAPQAAGSRAATLTISGENTDLVSIALQGTGVDDAELALNPPGLDFAPVKIGATSSPQTITIKNRRKSAVPAPTFAVSEKTFSIASTTCSAPLGADASCEVSVVFLPEVGGEEIAALVVTTGDQKLVTTLTGKGSGTVDVKRDGTGLGRVTAAAAGINCGTVCSGTATVRTVKLTAQPNAGSTFTGWSIDTCEGKTCQVSIDKAGQGVTATFTKEITPQLLRVEMVRDNSVFGTGEVNVSGGDTCRFGSTSKSQRCDYKRTDGEKVKLTAKPGLCSVFGGWKGACTGSSTKCTVTMSEALRVIAEFRGDPGCL